MINTPRYLGCSSSLLALLLLVLPLSEAEGQERLRDFSEGDGRIHGPPVLEVSEQDLHPGQVQTISLYPGKHTLVEFPYPVVQVDVGDPEIFMTEVVGSKMTLKATEIDNETSMTVMLGDEDVTTVPFLVRSDEDHPPLFVVRYTDPVEEHLNRAEERIADRISSDQDREVADLAEHRVRQRLLLGAEPTVIDKTAEQGDARERIRLEVDFAHVIPSEHGSPELYIRYTLYNDTVVPLDHLDFSLTVDRRERRRIFFEELTSRDLHDIRHFMGADRIEPGRSVRGVLLVSKPDFGEGESLGLTLEVPGTGHHLRVERILSP